jgi:hypothetical protein
MTDYRPPSDPGPPPAVDGPTLLAFLLGELPAKEAHRVEQALREDPALAAEARRLEATARCLRDTLQLSPLDEEGSPLRLDPDRRAATLRHLETATRKPRAYPYLRLLTTSPLLPLGLAAGFAFLIFALLPTRFLEESTRRADSVAMDATGLDSPSHPGSEALLPEPPEEAPGAAAVSGKPPRVPRPEALESGLSPRPREGLAAAPPRSPFEPALHDELEPDEPAVLSFRPSPVPRTAAQGSTTPPIVSAPSWRGSPPSVTDPPSAEGRHTNTLVFGTPEEPPAPSGHAFPRAPKAPSLSTDESEAHAEPAIAAELLPSDVLRSYPEIQTRSNRFFSIPVEASDHSFRIAREALARHRLPPPGSLRPEEFFNAFNYGDPVPSPGQTVATHAERALWPFAPQRELLRLSVVTGSASPRPAAPLNLVLVLNTSDSNGREDRQRFLETAFEALASRFQSHDTLSVVSSHRPPRLLLDGHTGNPADALERILSADLLSPSQDATSLEEALHLAFQTAARHFKEPGRNRLLLLTSGLANPDQPPSDDLKQAVEEHRRQGIALDICVLDTQGHGNVLLESLTHHGDGRYHIFRHEEDARNELSSQLAGILRPSAPALTVQIEFNPHRVRSYQLLGSHSRRLPPDSPPKDAPGVAEISPAEAGTALFLLEPVPGTGSSASLGVARIRYRDPITGEPAEHSWNLPSSGTIPSLREAPPALRLAAVAATFAALLNQTPSTARISKADLRPLAADLPEAFPHSPQVHQLLDMLQRYHLLAPRQ